MTGKRIWSGRKKLKCEGRRENDGGYGKRRKTWKESREESMAVSAGALG